MLLDVAEWGSYRLLGQTRDDAAGEAFDKVAKMLGLPYPGGRPIEQLALTGDSSHFRFARPMVRASSVVGDADFYDLSFSGLKTAVLTAVRGIESSGSSLEAERANIARSFQDAMIDTLVEKTERAVRTHKRSRIVLGGGVSCNSALQIAMQQRFSARGATVFAPSVRLATDNAAMIAAAGLFRFHAGERASLNLTAQATLPIPGLFAS